jgi:plastocyanin
MKTKIFYISFFIMLISTITLISCSKGNGYGSNNNPPAAAANSVNIYMMAFTPANITVAVGSTVVWTNNDGITHTVTSDDQGVDANVFDSGNIAAGSKYSRVFSTAGVFAYHCTLHPEMKGTVTVK